MNLDYNQASLYFVPSVANGQSSEGAIADSLSGAASADSLSVLSPYGLTAASTDLQSFFLPESTAAAVVTTPAEGVVGALRPYAVRTDNVLTASLILCFVIFVVALSRQGWLLARQAKDFFRTRHDDADDTLRPHLGFHLFMMLVCCHLLAIGSYVFATQVLHYDFRLEPQPLVVAIYFGLFIAYFLLKWMMYGFVNSVMFGRRARHRWTQAFLLLVAFEAVLLYPLILLLVYFDINAENASFWFLGVIILGKILTFYKAFCIFFREKTLSLQIFLYFCTLEITPLLALGGIWLMMTNQLRVNF